MKKSIRVLTLLLLSCLSTRVMSESSFYIPDIGSSARGVSIGNIRGFNNSSSVVFDNPGSLDNTALGASSFYASFMQGDATYYSLSTAFKLTPKINIGIGFNNLSSQDIPITDIDNSEFVQTGSTDYYTRQLKGVLSYALSDEVTVGIAGTGYEKKHTIVGRGVNMDLGVQWHHKNMALSLSGHDILPTYVSYSTGEQEPFASYWNLAGSYTHPKLPALTLFGQLGLTTSQTSQLTKAVGFSYFLTDDHILYVSGSYRDVSDLGEIRQTPAFGLGLELDAIRLEYVVDFSDSIEDNTQHYVSITLHLPKLEPLFKEALVAKSEPQKSVVVLAPAPKIVEPVQPVLAAAAPAPLPSVEPVVTVATPVEPTPIKPTPIVEEQPVVTKSEPVDVPKIEEQKILIDTDEAPIPLKEVKVIAAATKPAKPIITKKEPTPAPHLATVEPKAEPQHRNPVKPLIAAGLFASAAIWFWRKP